MSNDHGKMHRWIRDTHVLLSCNIALSDRLSPMYVQKVALFPVFEPLQVGAFRLKVGLNVKIFLMFTWRTFIIMY